MERTAAMKEKLQNQLKELKTLRDEIRVDLHLASMDLKDEWRQLEGRLPDPAKAADQLREATADAVGRLATEVKRFRARLRGTSVDSELSQLMSHAPITCTPSHSVAAAVAIMFEHDIGWLPVLGDDGAVVGTITDRDAAVAADTRGQRMDDIPVDTVMAREVCTVRVDAPVSEALALMRSCRVHRLPVIDDRGHLTGVITLNDVARAAARQQKDPDRVSLPGDVLATLATIAQPTPRQSASN